MAEVLSDGNTEADEVPSFKPGDAAAQAAKFSCGMVLRMCVTSVYTLSLMRIWRGFAAVKVGVKVRQWLAQTPRVCLWSSI